MSRILIRNLRRIRQLDFSIPTEFGTVFLLTGTNGSGKSTLFSCLSQIADPKILDQMFCPNVQFYESSASNTYTKSLITYETDAGTVSFHYGEDRWISSLSRENTLKILSSAGFSTVVYSGAHPKKIMTAQNLSVQDIQNADDDLRNALTVIFDDKNFRNLYYVTDHETQNVIYLLKENIDGQNYYFSENNFSRGERAIICLINKMANLPKHSLVLIDESEMSLHPKAQKRLLIYLQIFAAERQLQIILSTQSASIIKIFKPEKILFLEKENDQDGVLVCRRNVYPAAILGEMAFADEILPEMVLLVEDAEAAMLLEEIVSRLKQIVPLNFPYCKILPVGGYMQVVIMMDNFGKIFPSYVRQRAVLDKDAESTLNKAFKNPQRAHHDIVSRNYSRIYYLPCTPEQGMVTLLEQDPRLHSRQLQEMFQIPVLNLGDIMGEEQYRKINGNFRSDCKEKLSIMVQYLLRLSGEPESMIRRKLYRYYVQQYYSDEQKLKQDYCALIFKKE